MAAISLRRALLGGLVVLVATGIARAVAMGVTASLIGADVESPDPQVRRDGVLIGVGILTGVAAGGLVLALVARPAWRTNLGLTRPSLRSVVLWLFVLAAQAAFVDGAAALAGRPLVEPEWIDAYRTSPLALLAIALVLTSIFEELYFRGLLQGRLTLTRIGPAGAIASTALLFTLAHFPSDVWRFADVLSAAVLLGLARHYSGSSIPGMIPHVLGNLKVLVVLSASS